jgi:hypothetical protein
MPQKSASDVRLTQVRLLDPEGRLVAGKGVSYIYAEAIAGGGPHMSRPYAIKLPLNPEADLSDLLRTVSDYDR